MASRAQLIALIIGLGASSPAFADCSDIGIGGDIGKICDNVAHEVVTPALRAGTAVASTVGGTVAAAYLGLPPSVGAAAGNCYGQVVNSVAAGQGTPECVQQFPAVVARSLINQAQEQLGLPSSAVSGQGYPGQPSSPRGGGGANYPEPAGPATGAGLPPHIEALLCKTKFGYFKLSNPGLVGQPCGVAAPNVIVTGYVSLPAARNPSRLPDDVAILSNDTALLRGRTCALSNGETFKLNMSVPIGGACGKPTADGIVEGVVVEDAGGRSDPRTHGGSCKTAAGVLALGFIGLVGGKCSITAADGTSLSGVIVQ